MIFLLIVGQRRDAVPLCLLQPFLFGIVVICWDLCLYVRDTTYHPGSHQSQWSVSSLSSFWTTTACLLPPQSAVLHYLTKKMLYQHQRSQMWFTQIASYQQLNSNWHPSASEEWVSWERRDRFGLKQTTIRTCADSKRTHTKSNKDGATKGSVSG